MPKNIPKTEEPTHRGRGRPRTPLLTQELQDKIIQYLRDSNYVETACLAAGISKVTFYKWLEKGADPEYDHVPAYAQFRAKVLQAEAQAEVDDLAYIRAGRDNWQSRAWIRERRSRERWGIKHEISGPGGKGIPIEIVTKVVDDWHVPADK